MRLCVPHRICKSRLLGCLLSFRLAGMIRLLRDLSAALRAQFRGASLAAFPGNPCEIGFDCWVHSPKVTRICLLCKGKFVIFLIMERDTKHALEAVEKRMGEMETRLLERLEQTETRLLSAFHGWSTTMELRLKSLPATEQRLSILEDRLSAVERKLLERGQ